MSVSCMALPSAFALIAVACGSAVAPTVTPVVARAPKTCKSAKLGSMQGHLHLELYPGQRANGEQNLSIAIGNRLPFLIMNSLSIDGRLCRQRAERQRAGQVSRRRVRRQQQ